MAGADIGATREIFAKGSYAENFKAAQDIVIADDVDHCTLKVDRTDFANAGDALRAVAEISIDGGKSWQHLCGFTTGDAHSQAPSPAFDPSTAYISVPILTKGVSRQIRVHFEALKAVNTKVDLTTAALGIEAQPADMPHSAVFDATSSVDFGVVSSVSWTHTPSGTPTGLGVGVCVVDVNNVGTITSCTYDGGATTQEVTKLFSDVPNALAYRSSIYRLASPPTGAKTVAVNFPSSSFIGGCGAITVTGGDTSTVFSNNASASGTSTAPSVACTSAADELVMDAVVYVQYPDSVTASVGAGQTQRWNRTQTNSWALGSTESGAASVTMSWTLSMTKSWATCAASFKAAGGGGAGVFSPYYYREHIARAA